MRLGDHLSVPRVTPDLQATEKETVLRELAALLLVEEPEMAVGDAHAALSEREAVATTGIGAGVAIPHGRLGGMDRVLVALGVHRAGMDFDALDGKRVRIFFAVLAPEGEPGVHLKMLARISRLVRSESFRDAVLSADTATRIMEAIEHAEAGIV